MSYTYWNPEKQEEVKSDNIEGIVELFKGKVTKGKYGHPSVRIQTNRYGIWHMGFYFGTGWNAYIGIDTDENIENESKLVTLAKSLGATHYFQDSDYRKI